MFAAVCLWSLAAAVSEAATLSLSSSKRSISVGETATVRAVLNTQSAFINNGEAVITVPEGLAVESIAKQPSVFNLWVEEPSFSSPTRTLSFNGGVANPGYQGSSGGVVSFVVKGVKPGEYAVGISSASLRQNDGFGTDVASGTSGTSITVAPQAEPEPPKAKDAAKEVPKEEPAAKQAPRDTRLAAAPVVTSSTHPDQSLWYQSSDVSIAWKTSQKLSGIKSLLDAIPRSVPQGKTEPVSFSRSLRNVKDGVAYFHLRYVTASGVSDTAHFAIHVDSTPPDRVSAEISRGPKNERILSMSGDDALSGVESFDVLFNGVLQSHVLAVAGKASYAVPRGLEPGAYDVEVVAYDRARNKNSATVTFDLGEYEPPVITVSQALPYRGMPMTVHGEYGLPGKELSVHVRNPDGLLESYLVTPDAQGEFSISVPTWKAAGAYQVWAAGQADRNAGPAIQRTEYMVRANPLVDAAILTFWLGPLWVVLLFAGYWHMVRRTAKPVKKSVRRKVSDTDPVA